MKTKQIALIATALMSLSIINSSGQDYSAFYEARLSAQDHTTSDGAKLSDVASILRQDRANYHKFKKRDADDQTDDFFSSAKNRVLIDSYFKNVYSWQSDERQRQASNFERDSTGKGVSR